MEQRNLLLAIVLSVGILIGFQFLIEHFHLAKPPAPPTPAPGTTSSRDAGRSDAIGAGRRRPASRSRQRRNPRRQLTREAAHCRTAAGADQHAATARLDRAARRAHRRSDPRDLSRNTRPHEPRGRPARTERDRTGLFRRVRLGGRRARHRRPGPGDAVDRIGRTADPDLAGHVDLGQRPGARLYAHDFG